MLFHIAIATTQGVVFIERLVPEDSDVPSLVCLGQSSQRLGISNAYYDFVSKGSGLIEKDFGHAAWRLDVSDNIDQGDSWQLGVYLAHYFYDKGTLGTGKPGPGDQLLIVSGAVTNTRQVTAVSNVSDKIERATPVIAEYAAQTNVTLIFPKDNLPFDSPWIDENIRIVAAESLEQVQTALGHEATVAKPAPVIQSKQSRSGIRVPWFSLAAIVLLVAGVYWLTTEDDSVHSGPTGMKPGLIDDFGGGGPPPEKKPETSADYGPLMTIVARENGRCTDTRRQYPNRRQQYRETIAAGTCEVSIGKIDGLDAAYLVAADNGAHRALVDGGNHWRIPLPESTSSDRIYHIVFLETSMLEEGMLPLETYLQRMALGDDPRKLIAMIRDGEIEGEVFDHRFNSI